ncbi:hypothetical protein ACFCZ3_05735 [Cellulosimicrobium cellulans]|uniref:Uncharacterized protein n=1 Tax=Cellulosimicrobium cellulans F16 TaxID=1350482 RepID=A0A0M0F788_CELCE|nr:hypothetical protein [Cellulosimicrobium cellulans]KON73343.1 hypothetical protein M768_10405 [Cellulosimicrobium cellulans F16]
MLLSPADTVALVALCAATLVVTGAISTHTGPSSRLADAARRASPSFLVALVLIGAVAATQLGTDESFWYRHGLVGLFAGLAQYAAVLIAALAVVVGVGRLVVAAARRRVPAPPSTSTPVGPRTPTSAEPRTREATDDTLVRRRTGPWVAVATGTALLAAHVAVRALSGEGLLVLHGVALRAAWVNVLVPAGLGLVLAGSWVLSVRGRRPEGSWRLPAGAEVAGCLVGVGLLGGAALDLALTGGTTTLVLPARAGATCDVVVEQWTFLFTGGVDVLALPHGDVVATSVLTDGPVTLEERFPFREPPAFSAYDLAWDEHGATLSFDASDEENPWEVVRVDCP